MFRKVFIALVVCSSWSAMAQGSADKAAIRMMEKGRYNKALIILKKALHKDSTNVRASYLLGHYFFLTANPDYQLDSAYYYGKKASAQWRVLSAQEREKLARQGLDSASLGGLIYRVDSAAYQRAVQSNTVEDFEHFLREFHENNWRAEATRLRNDAAFSDATAQNTYTAFEAYLKKYPQSQRQHEARAAYERLLYASQTSDQLLSSYVRFLTRYPSTPYRREIERHIFELSTAPGTPDVFRQFRQRYPDSFYDSLAEVVYRHLLLDEARPDSVQNALDSLVVYPILRNGLFGLVANDGKVVLPPSLEELPSEYRCGSISEDVILLPDRLINTAGATVWTGHADAIEDIGSGFVAVEQGEHLHLIHKSGHTFFAEPVRDVKLLSARVFAIKNGDRWGLTTLTGRLLVPVEWDDINVIGDVLVFQKRGRKSLATIGNVTNPDSIHKKWVDGFDSVKRVRDNLLWVRSGEYEGVLDQTLAIRIRLDKHSVTATSHGFLLTTSTGQSFVNEDGVESQPARRVQLNGPWVTSSNDGRWFMVDPVSLERHPAAYDSIQFHGVFAVGLVRDSAHVWATRRIIIKVSQPSSFEFLPGQDSTGFLVITSQGRQTLYSRDGKKLFTGTFDRIQYGAYNLFIVQKKDRSKKDKKGLVNAQGKEILAAEYDAIVGPVDGVFSLLKGRKFGHYDVHSNLLINPGYDRNIQRYSEGVFVALREGKAGFIDEKNKPFTQFIFDQVVYWTDSMAMVQSGKLWTLLDFRSGDVVSPPFSEYKVVRDDANEKIFRIRQGNNYGIISNRSGTIIPPRFTDLVNVGSARQPVYFTEKHVEEASLYVVIYYDSRGKFIRKEVYEHDDYERIYCAK